MLQVFGATIKTTTRPVVRSHARTQITFILERNVSRLRPSAPSAGRGALFSSSPTQVWDFYLYWGDPALHHFVVLAFVIGNAEVILKVTLNRFAWDGLSRLMSELQKWAPTALL